MSETNVKGCTVHEYRVSVCDPCMKLEGQECHTPGCIFFLCSVPDVRHYLSRMLLRVDFGENDAYIATPEPPQTLKKAGTR